MSAAKMSAVNSPPSRLVISFLNLRKSIGYLGVTMPFVLLAGNYLAGTTDILSSISSYYHSDMRNIFVAIMAAIAVFAFAYRGYESKDNIAGDLTAIFALGVAFFPTTTDSSDPNASVLAGTLHLVFAALFFLSLAYFSLVLFPKTDPNIAMTARKLERNKIYRICGYTIIASLIMIVVYELFLEGRFPSLADYKPIFWIESVAVIAFGLSWLTKGEAILADEV